MNSLNTLYFPGTDIYSIRQYPLFLIFQNLHILQPVENDSAVAESSDTFIKSEFCQVHTPCPLGEDRDRFLHLLDDIRNRKDDYAAQLSSLMLAAKSVNESTGEHSERAIINSLFTPEDLQSNSLEAAREETLWQARLVLAIGEIVDEEEEEIAANLSVLDDDQAELFQALHGDERGTDEDDPFAELTAFKSNLTAANSANMKKRFNGWKALFREAELNEPDVFLTTSKDSGDLLLEAFHEETNHAAPLILSLQLPGLIGRSEQEAVQGVKSFSEHNSSLLSRLQATLKNMQSEDDLQKGALQELVINLEEQFEASFPEEQFGRIALNFFLFPGLSSSSLIDKKTNSGTQRDAQVKSGILAVFGE